jgi:hypothetical protein
MNECNVKLKIGLKIEKMSAEDSLSIESPEEEILIT